MDELFIEEITHKKGEKGERGEKKGKSGRQAAFALEGTKSGGNNIRGSFKTGNAFSMRQKVIILSSCWKFQGT